jgi:serine/threonine-protein kinase
MATLFMHAFEAPIPLSDVAPDVPGPIAEVVMAGLATNPGDRHATAAAFGVELAERAAQCWGGDWLGRVGIPVSGADAITAAATGKHHPATGFNLADAGLLVGVRSAAPSTLVRPTQAVTRSGVSLSEVARADVVPVQEVVKLRTPRLPYVLATLFALTAIALVVVGIGTPPVSNTPPATLTVSGVDPAVVSPVDLNLSAPIPVVVNGDTGADSALFQWSILGHPVGGRQVALTPGSNGLGAALPTPLSPYLVAGRLTGQLTLRRGPTAVATHVFQARSAQRAVTTAFAAAAGLLVLFSAAYLESYHRALRRGRNLMSAAVGLPLSAVVLAVAVAGVVWVLLGQQPTAAGLAAAGALAAAAGVCATVAALRASRIRRFTRNGRARRSSLPTTGR